MTKNFKESEFILSRIASEKGIDNTPTEEIKKQLLFTAAGMERIRALLKDPIIILSGFRSEKLNDAVGGSKNSQHIKGEAVDFVCPYFGTPKEVALQLNQWINVLGIDQLICEGTWVHVSFTLKPRGEALTLINGKYLKGIV